MKTEFKPPEPVEGKDFYIDGVYDCTVCIEVCVEASGESYSDEDVCVEAVDRFKNGIIDGDVNVVYSERVRDIALCWDTGEPFDRKEWLKKKLLELGLNSKCETLRPHEKVRPANEMILEDFINKKTVGQLKEAELR